MCSSRCPLVARLLRSTTTLLYHGQPHPFIPPSLPLSHILSPVLPTVHPGIEPFGSVPPRSAHSYPLVLLWSPAYVFPSPQDDRSPLPLQDSRPSPPPRSSREPDSRRSRSPAAYTRPRCVVSSCATPLVRVATPSDLPPTRHSRRSAVPGPVHKPENAPDVSIGVARGETSPNCLLNSPFAHIRILPSLMSSVSLASRSALARGTSRRSLAVSARLSRSSSSMTKGYVSLPRLDPVRSFSSVRLTSCSSHPVRALPWLRLRHHEHPRRGSEVHRQPERH